MSSGRGMQSQAKWDRNGDKPRLISSTDGVGGSKATRKKPSGGGGARKRDVQVPRPTGLRHGQTNDVLCENDRLPDDYCHFGQQCFYAHTAEEVVLMRAWREAKSLAARGQPWDYDALIDRLEAEVAVELSEACEAAAEDSSYSATSAAHHVLLPTSSDAFTAAFPPLASSASSGGFSALASGLRQPVAQQARLASPRSTPAAAASPAASQQAACVLAYPPAAPQTPAQLPEFERMTARTEPEVPAGVPQLAQLLAHQFPAAPGPPTPAPGAPMPLPGWTLQQEQERPRQGELPDYSTFHSFLCPISLVPFVDPVVAADGQTYERQEISDWLFRQQKDTSPCTGERLQHKLLVPNTTLRAAMLEVAQVLAGRAEGSS